MLRKLALLCATVAALLVAGGAGTSAAYGGEPTSPAVARAVLLDPMDDVRAHGCLNADKRNQTPQNVQWCNEHLVKVDLSGGETIDPTTGQVNKNCALLQLGCRVTEAAKGWFADLTSNIAEGAATLLGKAMSWWTQYDFIGNISNSAITKVQNSLWWVGMLILLGSIVWQSIRTTITRKPEGLVNIGQGGVQYVMWVGLGGLFVTVVYQAGLELSRTALASSLIDYANKMGQMLHDEGIFVTAALFFFALVALILSLVQWVLGFLRMATVIVLYTMLPTAAAGAMNKGTRPWLPKVIGWMLGLIAYQPMAAFIISIGASFISEAKTASDLVLGLTILLLSVLALPALMTLFSWAATPLFTPSAQGGSVVDGGGASGGGVLGGMLSAGGAMAMASFMSSSGPATAGASAAGGALVSSAGGGGAGASVSSAGGGGPGRGGGASSSAVASGVGGSGLSGAAGTGAGPQSPAAAGPPVSVGAGSAGTGAAAAGSPGGSDGGAGGQASGGANGAVVGTAAAGSAAGAAPGAGSVGGTQVSTASSSGSGGGAAGPQGAGGAAGPQGARGPTGSPPNVRGADESGRGAAGTDGTGGSS